MMTDKYDFPLNETTDKKLKAGMEKALGAFRRRRTLADIGYKPYLPYSQYEAYLAHVYSTGDPKTDRTGEGTLSVFGYQMRFNLQEGFPLITTKKVLLRAVIYELLWFLLGSHNNNWLKERGVTIWEDWAKENGELGPIYGAQWRNWKKYDFATIPDTGEELEGQRLYTESSIDQIAEVINTIKTNPNSRRIIVNAWNVADLSKMALTPCHMSFQFNVDVRRRLSCLVNQRSCDSFLGVPFNIASYALLTHMIAQQCELDVGDLVWTGGDCHIYANHMDQVELQLSRKPRPYPKLVIRRKPESIDSYELEDFEFVGYDPYPAIKAPRAL